MKERKRTDTTPRYDPDALRANIQRCHKNIAAFKEAIEKERANIVNLTRLLKEAERGDRL